MTAWVPDGSGGVKDISAETGRNEWAGPIRGDITDHLRTIPRDSLKLERGITVGADRPLRCRKRGEVHQGNQDDFDCWSGEGISNHILGAFHMADVRGVLRDEGQVARLTWRPVFGTLQGICQGLMIREYHKCLPSRKWRKCRIAK